GILRGLLADGRPAANPSSACVAFHRIFNGFEVETAMRAELPVLCFYRPPDHVAIDLADRHPLLVSATACEQIADHREGDGWVDEAVGEHPQNRDQQEGDDQLDDPSDDAAHQGIAPS